MVMRQIAETTSVPFLWLSLAWQHHNAITKRPRSQGSVSIIGNTHGGQVETPARILRGLLAQTPDARLQTQLVGREQCDLTISQVAA
jgi:hypothetical protein